MKTVSLLFLLGILVACGSSDSQNQTEGPSVDSATDPPGSSRDWLTAEILLNGTDGHRSPIHNDYFLPVGEFQDELHTFSGSIQLNSRRLQGTFAEYAISGDESFKNFPNVVMEFVSDRGRLIPRHRGRQLRADDNSFWGLILEPGRVWSELGDDGWSRASFPFEFISARRNNVHNGLATFLYNDTEISQLRIQVVQETNRWFRHDIHSQLDISYFPQSFPEQDTLVQDFNREVEGSVPSLPWSELSELDTNLYNSYLDTTDISAAGLILDGQLYTQPCYTRYGNYPYPRWMRHGVYSITKSLGASLTMMRLAQKYGETVYQLKINQFLNITANHNGWDEVTFADVLNMAAGIGDNGTENGSGDIFADENTPKMEDWLVKPTVQEKLDIAFSYGNYDWGPNEVFRYNSVMTFVLGAAMDSFYQSQEGEGASIWQMMLEEVYHPIGIQHVPILTTSEVDATESIPEFFHGLYLNQDDIAKLTLLLQNNGIHNGEQLLHAAKLQESLFQTSNMGLHSWWEDNAHGQSRYLYSFWTSPIDDGTCTRQIPYMSGYGGNILAILPNGLSLYRFADADSYSPFNMIEASIALRSICP